MRTRVGVGHRWRQLTSQAELGLWQDDGRMTHYTSHEHRRSGALRVQGMASSSQHVIGNP